MQDGPGDPAGRAKAKVLPRQGWSARALVVLCAGRPAGTLHRLAVEGGYGLLVVGTRGAGLSKALLGSVATTLAGGSKMPVLLAGGEQQPQGRAPFPRPLDRTDQQGDQAAPPRGHHLLSGGARQPTTPRVL